MKKSKYSDSQIVSILKQAEAGQPVKEIGRKFGITLVRSARLCRFLYFRYLQMHRVQIASNHNCELRAGLPRPH
jgi:hypothetical protein